MTTSSTGREVSRASRTLPSTLDEDRVRRIIAVTGRLPPVPHVAARMMELVGKDGTSVRDLHRIVSADPALAARILETANSVFYSFDQKVTNLAQALVVLGSRAVTSMAVASSSRSLFVKEGVQFGLKEKLLWEHSMVVAIGCRQIARTVGHENEEAAYITGLLHDAGKAILNRVIPEKYGRIVEEVCNEGRSFADVEQQTLGFDHSDLGALVAQEWNFDRDMVEAIAGHHRRGARSSGAGLAAILALANTLGKRLGIGLERPGDPGSAADHWSAGVLGLDDNACREIQEIMKACLEGEKHLYAA